MPQLDKFTYFTQFFWLCLFFLFILKYTLPTHMEAKIYLFYNVHCKWLFKFLLFGKVMVFVIFLLHTYNLIKDQGILSIVYFLDSEQNAAIIQLPAQEVEQDVLWDDLNAREPEAAAGAEEEAISRTVEAIMEQCFALEKKILKKKLHILQKSNYIIEDPADVRRAVEIVMVDQWEIDIDRRINHFRNLLHYCGNPRYAFWNEILEELSKFNIHQSSS